MENNKLTETSNLPDKLEGYDNLLNDIKSILDKGLSKAYQAVDNIRVQTYWQIGERIVREELAHKDRADYGSQAISKLAVDLDHPERNIWRYVQFYRMYPILSSVMTELSWTHYIYLLTVKTDDARRFYEIQIAQNRWSVDELRKRIKSNDYENAREKGQIVSKISIPIPAPEDVFKGTYNWTFTDLTEEHTESELEQALLNNIQKTLLEFGSGFAFVARQQKILINGQWERVDLLFYHILLKCYIIIDLKARELRRGDIEQVTRYLSYFRDKKVEGDRDPIALIICQSHNKIDVYYSAGKDREDIFVAEYKTKLPSEDEIKSKLKKLK